MRPDMEFTKAPYAIFFVKEIFHIEIISIVLFKSRWCLLDVSAIKLRLNLSNMNVILNT